MKKRLSALCAAAVLLLGAGFYLRGGGSGIPEDRINTEQAKNVSWDAQDYQTMGASDGKTLYVGVMYRKDYSDARYFIYIKKGGLSFGWHFLCSGGLSEQDGLRVFDCGEYGTAYVALNRAQAINRIEFEDGSEPAVIENVTSPVCVRSESAVHFYDAAGKPVEPNRMTLLH